MSEFTNKVKLAYLIKKLHININEIKEDTDDGMDKRIKLQKIVYFTKLLGVDFEYNYSMYLHGPYSPELAKDYYSLNQADVDEATVCEIIDKFYPRIEQLYLKETIWLETAASITNVKKSNLKLDWKHIIDHVYNIKSDILSANNKDSRYVEQVSEDLKTLKLIDN